MSKLQQYNADVRQELEGFVKSAENKVDVVVSRDIPKILDDWKIFDAIISERRIKNISIRILSSPDDGSKHAIKRIVPFAHYKTIDPSSITPDSVIFIKDVSDIFAIEFLAGSSTINHVVRSKDILIVKVVQSSFDGLWQHREDLEKLNEEKRHSDLLLDILTHDLSNHNQIIAANLELSSAIADNLLKAIDSGSNIDPDAKTITTKVSTVLDLEESISAAQRTTNRTISIIDNVRMIEKMHREKDVRLFPCNLIDAIDSAYSTVQKLFEERKKVVLDVAKPTDNQVLIKADGLLEEIFVNLFSNSAKYTETKHVKIDINISENLLGEKKYWMINVSDYGPGIPDTIKEELFQRFYLKSKGSGLGLAIVKTLVERYKGKVWIADRVYKDYTKGVTFGMIIPAYP